MVKSIAAHWQAMQSQFVNHTQQSIKAIIRSADLVAQTWNHIENLTTSVAKARKSR